MNWTSTGEYFLKERELKNWTRFQDHLMAIDTKTGQVSIFPIWSGLIVPIQVHELDFSRYQMGYVSMESQKRKD